MTNSNYILYLSLSESPPYLMVTTKETHQFVDMKNPLNYLLQDDFQSTYI